MRLFRRRDGARQATSPVVERPEPLESTDETAVSRVVALGRRMFYTHGTGWEREPEPGPQEPTSMPTVHQLRAQYPHLRFNASGQVEEGLPPLNRDGTFALPYSADNPDVMARLTGRPRSLFE